ncbi:MAG: MCE family protein [Candidatus Aminicenantes bacterium]|nr:MCE family protein [Candidatus Aminicenantes bacterium]
MKREAKIGIFLAAIFVIMAVSVFFLGKVGRLFNKQGYVLTASFESVAGLDPRAVVRIGGVRVGFVESISLEGSRPAVRIVITRPDIKVPVDSRATLASLGMLGEKYVEIMPGASKQACRPGDRLEAMASVSLDQLGSLMLSIGAEIKEVGNSLREMVSEENRRNVEAALHSLASLTDSLDAFMGDGGRSLSDGARDISLAARDARQAILGISGDLSRSADALRGLLEDSKGLVKSNLEKVRELLDEVETAVKKLDETMDKINKGEGALGRLIQDPDWRDRTEQVLDGAAGAARAVGSLEAALDVRSEYYGDSRLFKSGMGFRTHFGRGNLVETRLTRDPWREETTYSLQLGRRFGAFSPRAGIIESDFGLGVDYETLGRRLRLSLDTFDFNRGAGPRFRFATRLIPVEPLFLVVGVDDFSLASGREFYVGLGIEAR